MSGKLIYIATIITFLFLLSLNSIGQETYVFSKSFPEGPVFDDSLADIAVDDSGNIYTVNDTDYGLYGRQNILKLSPDGKILFCFGKECFCGERNNITPYRIALDNSGNFLMLVYDNNGNDAIQKYSSKWVLIATWNLNNDDHYSSIAVDKSGNIYVSSDSTQHRIQKLTPNGEFIKTWGMLGNGDGEFNYPEDIAIDSSGFVYVADMGNERIQKFDSEGNFLAKWGTEGKEDGQFRQVDALAVDSAGNIYAIDGFNHRVQKFSKNGEFLLKWEGEGVGIALDKSGNVYIADVENMRIQKFSPDGAFLKSFGARSDSKGFFNTPIGVALEKSGNIYIADTGNHRIQKFSSDGTFLTSWGRVGKGGGLFEVLRGIAIDNSGNVYVVDESNCCVQKFTPEGKFLKKWGESGVDDGQFSNPVSIAIDNQDNVYVANQDWSPSIQKFTSEGKFLKKWGGDDIEDGKFNELCGITTDNSGNVYAVDSSGRTQVFNSDGIFLKKWKTGEKALFHPYGLPYSITADNDGSIYIVDSCNAKIRKYGSSGLLVTEWGTRGGTEKDLCSPTGIDVDDKGNVYVVDNGNNQVKKFRLASSNVEPIDKMATSWGRVKDELYKFDLGQNFPNPFNPETWIPYQLKEDADVEIKIYRESGQLIRAINLGYKPAGTYTNRNTSAYWDGKNEAGEQVASGVYFYTIQAGSYRATRKMIIVR